MGSGKGYFLKLQDTKSSVCADGLVQWRESPQVGTRRRSRPASTGVKQGQLPRCDGDEAKRVGAGSSTLVDSVRRTR